MKKRIALLLALVLCLGLATPVLAAARTSPPFSDVPPDHWASSVIERCWQEGVLQGAS